jgi:hypothetical protein
MLMINQSMMGIGEAGVAGGNDAVRLWDGINSSNTTWLYETSNNIVNPVKLPSSGTLSCWIKRENWSGMAVRLFTTYQNFTDERGLRINIDNTFRTVSIGMFDVSGNAIMFFTSSGAFLNDASWQHLLMSWSSNIGGNTARAKAVINDITALNSTAGNLGRTPFERGSFWINQDTASSATQMSLYDLFIADGEYDVTDTTIKRKFIDVSGNPVYLGADGSIPFGSQPRLFYSGASINWRNNKGYLSNSNLLASTPANFTLSPTKP